MSQEAPAASLNELVQPLARPFPRTRLPISLSGTSAVIWLLLAAIAAAILYPLILSIARVAGDVVAGTDTVRAQDLGGTQFQVYANTVVLVVTAGGLAMIVGSLLAWINERTDGTLWDLGRVVPLAPLLVHPLASASGWIVLLDQRVGLVNNWIRSGLGLVHVDWSSGPINIYSFPGLIFISSLQLVPFVFLIVSGALASLDPGLEEASRIHGAGPAKTLFKVTLPAIRPALANAAVVTAILGIGLFTVPIVIGTGARIDVLSVRIYNLINAGFPPRNALALVLAAALMVVIQGLLLLQRAAVQAGHHAAVSGRGFRSAKVELGRWRVWARVFVLGYFIVTAVLPAIGLIMVSLQRFWSPTVDLAQMGLANFHYVLFENPGTSQALLRSVALAAVGATLVMLVAAVLMLQVDRGDGIARQVADVLTAVPATIPATVLGVGMLIAFSRPPIRLYGSPLLLLLAYVIVGLPFASRTAAAAASEIGPEMAEASRVCRGSGRTTFFRILLPLALPGLAAGWILNFVLMVGETTASALLSGTGNLVIGRVLLDLWANGSFPQMASLALIMSAINAACILAVLRLTRRSIQVALS
ncbi:MAG TPA: iron ABC transporter permease [Chloroflexota bacterium]|nr:iron ABC transporter permease [Chloroflexota bacterium]